MYTASTQERAHGRQSSERAGAKTLKSTYGKTVNVKRTVNVNESTDDKAVKQTEAPSQSMHTSVSTISAKNKHSDHQGT
jgi:hypothetical protein